MKYLAYFQAYTNTYARVEQLRQMYEEALEVEDVVGIVIGTRPDCVAASELSAEDIFHVLSGTSPHSSEYDALTNQSIEEISEIFDASEEQEKAAKASDVEMEWSADKMQQFLNGEGIDQDADHSAESQQS